MQIPLILGWALTIYKAQGQTLPAVIYDPGTKESKLGQSIVATSRTPTAESLFIKQTDRNRWSKHADEE